MLISGRSFLTSANTHKEPSLSLSDLIQQVLEQGYSRVIVYPDWTVCLSVCCVMKSQKSILWPTPNRLCGVLIELCRESEVNARHVSTGGWLSNPLLTEMEACLLVH